MKRQVLSARGSTLLDIVVGTAILLTVFVGLFGVLQLGPHLATDNKSRTGALALALERIELVRSLDYDDIGTLEGGDQNNGHGNDPDGSDAGNPGQGEGGPLGDDYELLSTYYEYITLNGVDYTRRTRVVYHDDAADGIGTGPDENHKIQDYKVVRVSVAWEGRNEPRVITLVSNFAPQGIEQ